ncbi:MAG: peptidyl-prolyl cis-trans isomerase [Ignavibacteriaceae bacterium]|nr:peptidyl-prolyl cis-trans isomerase [Ignavibacteriaceae bacterium]
MKLFSSIILTIIIFAVSKNYAFNDSLLVKIGNSGITKDEFQQRFELIPQVSGGVKKDIDQKKHDLLYSLIAEKLWAKEAEQLKLDTSDIMTLTFKTIEKMYVRDALYKIEITDKIKITDQERLEGLQRIYNNLVLDVLKFKDSASANEIYSRLKNEITFDSAKSILNSQIPSVQIKFGEMTENVEDMLYSLNEGEHTKPVKSSSGWLIFKLVKKEPAAFSKRDQAVMNVEEIIKQRKTDYFYNEFYGKFFGGRKVETDAVLFRSIAEKISSILTEKKNQNSISDSENVYLDASDLLKMESEFGEASLAMPFIKLDKGPISLKQFLREFIFEGFYSPNVKLNVISAKLNSRVKTFIEHELLAREGYYRGLQNLPEVKNSIAMWKDNYLAKILKNILIDSVKVSDEEVYAYYKNRNQLFIQAVPEVNIIEILTDSLDVIDHVFRELEEGKDFRKLASLYTKRIWTKTSGGEFGFFPVTMYGEIGKAAANMNVGEIYGPVKLPEGYSIFKLIDKREKEIDTTLSFEETKEEIKKNLSYKKLGDFFIDYTVKLANKFGVTINEQLLKSIELLDMNLFVYRYMGFGGRINAVPMVLPFNEWFLPWKESKKLTP